MKVLLVCNTDGALYVFRKPIIDALRAQGHDITSISGRSTYFERLEKLGVRALELDFSRHSVSAGRNLGLLFSLSRMIRRCSPDVVHCFTHKAAIYGTLAARLTGCRKIFVTITGLGSLFVRDDARTRVLRLLLLLQYRLALIFARTVFFQNPDDFHYFLSRRIVSPEKTVLTHGSGLDLANYSLPSPDEIEASRRMIARELGDDLAGKKVILFPSRAVREKGFFEFYAAAASINLRHRHRYAFIHLGLIDVDSNGGLSMSEVQALAHRSGVRYLGFKENIEEYMRGADVVVLPSYREGTPRSLIEALAFGKAIVTTDAPGCRETVVDGWNGSLCKVADVPSLVSAVLAIDDDFVHRARSRSRELCETKFDSAHLVRLTIPRYSSTVEG
jgi:N,N'-diacetylbacillosaminyl-diphospho-undecaprenol alpha-1,3-N-acetylgalactosaminyltransferase